LVKPYEPSPNTTSQPPLGILYLISSLRRALGDRVEVSYEDLWLNLELPESFVDRIAGRFDLVGISALNYEAAVTERMARALHSKSPETIVAVGGPYPRSSPERLLATGAVDWLFRGESDRTFPKAVEEWFFGSRQLDAITGLTWRAHRTAPFVANPGEDSIEDLDSLPLPAWDLVPFDLYARGANMNNSLRAKRYAPLFTSRGCPYRCHYCHDLFGKGFRWRSPENVAKEIDLLVDRYGVREFQIVDDIYNLHKPRMRDIARRVIARHGKRQLHFCFPNGIRADIIDVNDLPLLRDMGVYDMSIAIETVSPRLQTMIDKNLDIGRAARVIDAAAAAGISTKGFFMLGFPTETQAEMESTIQFALASKLTMAHFFFVVPQEGTPLYDLAQKEAPGALAAAALRDYYTDKPWYQLAYGVDMGRIRSGAILRFYADASRIVGVVRRTNFPMLVRGAWFLIKFGFWHMFTFRAAPDTEFRPVDVPRENPTTDSPVAGGRSGRS
jgi:radical SAM superfamily enzyme YgiQ (UPF0313 family)